MDFGHATSIVLKSTFRSLIKKFLIGRLAGLGFLANSTVGIATYFIMKVVGWAIDEGHGTIVKQLLEMEAHRKGDKLDGAKTDEEVIIAFGNI